MIATDESRLRVCDLRSDEECRAERVRLTALSRCVELERLAAAVLAPRRRARRVGVRSVTIRVPLRSADARGLRATIRLERLRPARPRPGDAVLPPTGVTVAAMVELSGEDSQIAPALRLGHVWLSEALRERWGFGCRREAARATERSWPEAFRAAEAAARAAVRELQDMLDERAQAIRLWRVAMRAAEYDDVVVEE